MWAYQTSFYQFYPLGFCGAPKQNDGILVNRISKIENFIPHLVKLNIGGIYLSPIFDSDNHGYDTRDYGKIDCRLGTNDDFKNLCEKLHSNNIKVVLDGVFNHVGRGFWAFEDVKKNRENSPYRYWFNIDFGGNSCYDDGFWYEGWEGHYELVKLNLDNNDVVEHIFENVGKWIDEFKIDGLRLDVAYLLSENFMHRLREFTSSKKADFALIGECIHGDYNKILNHFDSVTNYECYKGLHSSFNSMNMFEIAHSLGRQFGSEQWCLYRGRHLLNFVDNHDVSRIASILNDKEQIKSLYTMLFAMPGIPCIYYGSEWGILGEKSHGDDALRPEIENPSWNDLCEHIAKLAEIKNNSHSLNYGDYFNLQIQNKYLILERKSENQRVIVAVNASGEEQTAHFNANCGRGKDLMTGQMHDFGGGSTLPAYSSFIWECEV
ncbi:MAG: alpha-amylase family glycosyl hydrolase [Clostridia bacterium]